MEIDKKRNIVLIYLALGVVVFLAYQQVRHNEFVNYDDYGYVTENPHIKDGITPQSVYWALTARYAANWHPLTWLSHMLDYKLFGLSSSWHHMMSLFFHIANTLLLFWILKRMTGRAWASLFVAAVFALHPLNVDSFAWVSERKNVLSGFFWFLTIAAYIRYSERPALGRYLVVGAALCLGLMSKPTVVVLPFALLLLDYWPLGRVQWRNKWADENLVYEQSGNLKCPKSPVWRLVVEKAPFFLLAAPVSVFTIAAQKSVGALGLTHKLSFYVRAVNACTSYFGYICKIFYPHNLAVLYPYPTVLRVDKALVFLLITAFIIRYAKGRGWLVMGWFWYLGTLFPVIGLVQAGGQAMADRYIYLPGIGIFIIAAWGAAELCAKWPYRRIILGVSATIVLAMLLICSRIQITYWRNSLTLFEHAVTVTKNNAKMHENYAYTLLEEGRLDEAYEQICKTLSISPNHLPARRCQGNILIRQGKYDAAIECFNQILNEGTDEPEAEYNNLGTAYLRQGKYDMATECFRKALSIREDFPEAAANLKIALKRQSKPKGD
ncbi:MAG: tetratricopeptide repeat protein [Sedimentisphaerales bacterium]|nr:tetratricopeptide repeat protein [Sedimentisphaerales bacterium]